MDYYVYMLFDENTDEVFYVGKGQGYRIDEHEKEKTESEKVKRIKNLKAENKFGKRILGRFRTESEAFAVESILIKWMYGFSNLTNLTSGHNSIHIRGKGDLSELKGIDVERMLSFNDGDYTKDQRKKIVNNNVEEKLLYVQELSQKLLEDSYFVSEPDISAPQDPTVYIHRDGWPARIRLKLGLAGKKLSPAFMALSAKDSDSFIEFLTGKDVSPKFGRYTYTLWKNYVKDTNSSFDGECEPSIDNDIHIKDLITSMVKILDAELTSPE